jgi:hypothetical protein
VCDSCFSFSEWNVDGDGVGVLLISEYIRPLGLVRALTAAATSPHRLFFPLSSVFRLHILRTVLSLHAGLALPRTARPPLTILVFLFLYIARFSIMATSPPQSSPSLSSNAHFFSQYTNGHLPARPRTSESPSIFRTDKVYPASIASTPEVQINGRPRQSRPSTSSASTHTHDDATWGSHFWVTLVDPQVRLITTLLVHYL